MPMLNRRNTLDKLLSGKKLFDIRASARITGYCERYVRQLCREKKINHQRILGRYYMTPADIADLLTPVVKAKAK